MLPDHWYVVQALLLHDMVYECEWHAWWDYNRGNLHLAAQVYTCCIIIMLSHKLTYTAAAAAARKECQEVKDHFKVRGPARCLVEI